MRHGPRLLSDPAITGVLDIGTSKVVCLIASRTGGRSGLTAHDHPFPGLRIVGVGHQRAGGIKAGVVIDLEEAERCIRAALAQAERMAGVTLDSVHVSIACGRLKSHAFTASADIESGRVSARDIARLMAGARAYVERDGRLLVHHNRKALQLDGAVSGESVIGLSARHITADLHSVSADEAPLRNLSMVLDRCHVRMRSVNVASYASALAVTSSEERALGTTVLDFGCGTTKLAAFSGGHLVAVHSVPLGAGTITSDIARALHTPLIEAERIKALYGNLLSARSDEHEGFSYPTAGSDEAQPAQATRAQLASIIRPRVAEILHAVAQQPYVTNLMRGCGDKLILTGGGSLLTGIAEFASHVLQRPVRTGQTVTLPGLPPVARTPAFSTAAGLLFASEDHNESVAALSGDGEYGGYFERVGAWLKSGF